MNRFKAILTAIFTIPDVNELNSHDRNEVAEKITDEIKAKKAKGSGDRMKSLDFEPMEDFIF